MSLQIRIVSLIEYVIESFGTSDIMIPDQEYCMLYWMQHRGDNICRKGKSKRDEHDASSEANPWITPYCVDPLVDGELNHLC